jgi:3-oxoadipate enol-lactonase
MRANINGIQLNYRLSGPEKAPAVVLVHGFPFGQASWDGQVAALEKEHRVLTYDLRGLGGSALGPAPQPLETYVDDLFALMDYLKLADAALVGLSMGGYIALRAAQREPGRFRALVLCDTKAEADNDEGRLKRAAGIQTVWKKGVRAFSLGMLPSLVAKPDSPVGQGLLKIMAANKQAGVANALAAMAGRSDTTGALAGLKLPVLVLHGELDKLMPLQVGEALAAKIPGAKLVPLPGAGHVSNLDAPEAFNRALSAFLSQK